MSDYYHFNIIEQGEMQILHRAKEMLIVDDVENKEFLRNLLEAMYEELPAPKKKK